MPQKWDMAFNPATTPECVKFNHGKKYNFWCFFREDQNKLWKLIFVLSVFFWGVWTLKGDCKVTGNKERNQLQFTMEIPLDITRHKKK